MIFDDSPCTLGEGPLWHPERGELLWFDIMGKTLHAKNSNWAFDEHVSAAGWIDRDKILIASESQLMTFDLSNGDKAKVVDLEADMPLTRSNDGRADPWGGFWIGTMGKNAEAGAGAIYRYYRGELRQLFAPLTITNSICFSPDKRLAYFSDTTTSKVMRVALDKAEGWPVGEPEVFIDLSKTFQFPDGAVIDATGNMWLALWGSSCVAQFSPSGEKLSQIDLPATQITCPAFGGEDLATLYATSATVGLSASAKEKQPNAGMTFQAPSGTTGQMEHQVIL